MKSILAVQGTDTFKKIDDAYNDNISKSLTDDKKSLFVDFLAYEDYDKALFVTQALYDSEDVSALVKESLKLLSENVESIDLEMDEEKASSIANAIYEKNYKFDTYKTKKEDFVEVSVFNNRTLVPKPVYKKGLDAARDFGNTPANRLTPRKYAKEIAKLMSGIENMSIRLLDETIILNEKMYSLHSIAKGSAEKPMIVVMEYRGDAESEEFDALVGKGVTFDAGGISLKPSAKMDEMKFDMCGSAAVVGAMHAIATSGVKKNVVGIVGLVENLPSHNAVKPGDVVTSRAGLSIEVLNTDAEGRMVLCDIMDYVQDKYTVKRMVDVATLTGAIVVCLGDQFAGLFSNSDELVENIHKAGDESSEKYCRMPLCEAYDEQLKGEFGDIRNIGTGSPGASTAAQFLQRFVKDGVEWAHLDIAGVANAKKATGFGVKTLFNLMK